MRTIVRCFLLFGLVAVVPRVAAAQATLAGEVKDTTGAVLPGVTVEAASPALIEKVRTAVTDGSGRYRIESLPPGSYTVTFSLTGFAPVKRDGPHRQRCWRHHGRRGADGRRRGGNGHGHGPASRRVVARRTGRGQYLYRGRHRGRRHRATAGFHRAHAERERRADAEPGHLVRDGARHFAGAQQRALGGRAHRRRADGEPLAVQPGALRHRHHPGAERAAGRGLRTQCHRRCDHHQHETAERCVRRQCGVGSRLRARHQGSRQPERPDLGHAQVQSDGLLFRYQGLYQECRSGRERRSVSRRVRAPAIGVGAVGTS